MGRRVSHNPSHAALLKGITHCLGTQHGTLVQKGSHKQNSHDLNFDSQVDTTLSDTECQF